MFKNIFQKYRHPTKLTVTDWLVLVVGLAIFTTISLWTIDKSSVWFDEAFGAYLIRFNFVEIARYTGADVHPPLYYWLLKAWSMWFGTSEFALRSMSTFFAGIAIIFGYLLTHRLFGKKAAKLSLLFMILAPMLIRYSQEMRMYALVTAIALAATYVLVIANESKNRKPWIIYGVLVSLGMWTHYFSALVWLSHWVWRAYVVRESNGKKVKDFMKAFFSKNWITAYVVAIGVYLPWVPFLIHQVLDVQINGFWIPPVTPTTIPNFFTNVLFYREQDSVLSWMALAFIGVVTFLGVLAVRRYFTLDKTTRQSYMLICSMAFVPVILLFLASLPPLRPSFVDRYLIPSTLAISLFIGVTIALSHKKIQWVTSVVIVGVMIVGIANVYQFGNYNKTLNTANETRQIVQAAIKNGKPGEPIIADSPWLFYEAVFYETPEHPIYFLNSSTDYKYGSLNMLRENEQHKIRDLVAFSREHPTIWYIGRPGGNELNSPEAGWKAMKQVTINDAVNYNPSYKAIEFKTTSAE